MFRRFSPTGWPDNIRSDRDAVTNEIQMPKGEKASFCLPLIPATTSRATKSIVTLALLCYFLGVVPQVFMLLRGLWSLLEPLLNACLFALGTFLWTMPDRRARQHLIVSWVGCIVATVIAFFLSATVLESYLLGIVFFVVALSLLSRVFLHGLAIRGSAPQSIETRKNLASAYRHRFNHFTPRGGIFLFLPPLILLVVAFVLATWPWASYSFFRNWFAVFVFGGLAFVWLTPLILGVGDPKIRIADPYRASWTTLSSFLTYNPLRVSNPTAFRSPAGSYAKRRSLFLAAVVFAIPLSSPFFVSAIEESRRDLAASTRRFARHEAEKEQDRERFRDGFLRPSFLFGNDQEQETRRVSIDDLDDETIRQLKRFPDRVEFHDDRTITIHPFDPNQGSVDYRRTDEIRQLENELRRAEADELEAKFDSIRSDNFRIFSSLVSLGYLATLTLLLVSPVFPVLLVVGLLAAVAGRAFAKLDAKGLEVPTVTPYQPANWDSLIARLRSSEDEIEKNSLLLGVNEADGCPVLVPRNAFREHAHFLGATGSGKTARGLAPLLSQLLNFGDSTVIVLDLKGDDQTLFEELRLSAQCPFKFFTPETGRGSYRFNLFLQPFWQSLSVSDKADLLTTSLGLYYGSDYGRKYYSDINFSLIEKTLQQKPDCKSFSELWEQMRTVRMPGANKKDAANAQATFSRLARHGILNLTDDLDPESDLCLQSIFREPEAWFLSIPASMGSSVNPDIARLFCFALLGAAKHSAKPRKQVYLVIDEFQRMVSANLEIILQLARSHDISVILANQAMADLEQVGSNLPSVLETNTRIRQVFSVYGRDQTKDLIETAGEFLIQDTSFTTLPNGTFGMPLRSIIKRYIPSSRLRINDILAASDAPGSSILYMQSGAGYAQFAGLPIIAHSTFHISEDEYLRRHHSSWPPPSDCPHVNRELDIDIIDEGTPSIEEVARDANPKDVADLLANLDQDRSE